LDKIYQISLSVASPCFTADTAAIRYNRATMVTDRLIGFFFIPFVCPSPVHASPFTADTAGIRYHTYLPTIEQP